MTDLKAKMMEQAAAAYEAAKGINNIDGMLRATELLLRIWLKEAGRYAQVHTGVSVGYSGNVASPGPTIIGCGDLTAADIAAYHARTACSCSIPCSGASTSELHSGGYSWNGDESV